MGKPDIVVYGIDPRSAPPGDPMARATYAAVLAVGIARPGLDVRFADLRSPALQRLESEIGRRLGPADVPILDAGGERYVGFCPRHLPSALLSLLAAGSAPETGDLPGTKTLGTATTGAGKTLLDSAASDLRKEQESYPWGPPKGTEYAYQAIKRRWDALRASGDLLQKVPELHTQLENWIAFSAEWERRKWESNDSERLLGQALDVAVAEKLAKGHGYKRPDGPDVISVPTVEQAHPVATKLDAWIDEAQREAQRKAGPKVDALAGLAKAVGALAAVVGGVYVLGQLQRSEQHHES